MKRIPVILYFSAALQCFVGVVGYGLWLCAVLQILMPRFRDASATGWQWSWFQSSSWLTLVAGGVGVSLLLSVMRVCACVPSSLATRLPGVLLCLLWVVAWAVSWAVGDVAQWGVMLWAAMLCCGYVALFVAAWQALGVDRLFHHEKTSAWTGRLSPWLLGLFIAVFSWQMFQAGAADRNANKLSGDEPSYAFMTVSLLNEFNLHVNDEEHRVVNTLFNMPASRKSHQIPFPASDSSDVVPWHFPGPSVVLLPAWPIISALERPQVGVRFYMLGLYFLWVIGSYVLSRRLTGAPMASLFAAVAVAVTTPMLGVSKNVYPDHLTGYLLLVALLCAGRSLCEKDTRLTVAPAVAVLVVACLLPWMHLKYVLLSVALGVLVVWKRPLGLTRRQGAILACVVLSGMAVYAAYYLSHYGVRLIGEPNADVPKIRDGFLGMLLDNDSGWLTYAPWVLLVPVGCVALWRMTGTAVYPVVWVLLFLGIYLPTAAMPFWGTMGTPVMRYCAPFVAVCAPLLAAAFVHLRRCAVVPAVLVLVPLMAVPTFLDDTFLIYGPQYQIGRRLLEESFAAFSWQEFFPYFNMAERMLHVPLKWWHGGALLVYAAAFAVATVRWRGRPGVYVTMLVTAPMVLAVLACVCRAPNFTMNAVRLFAAQTDRLIYTKNDGAAALATLNLPITLRPVDIPPARELSLDNALNIWKARTGNVLGSINLDNVTIGRYRVTLCGRPKNAKESSGTLTSDVGVKVNDKETTRVLFTAGVIPARNKAKPVPFAGFPLVQGEVTVEGSADDAAQLSVRMNTVGVPDVYIDTVKFEYLGSSLKPNIRKDHP